MRIAVIGAGGVGGYFGGRLAEAGNDVTFVARGTHLEAIQENGLRINSPKGDVVLQNARFVDHISRVDAADLVMVCVKLWDTEGIATELKRLVDQGAMVISFQNGVLKDDILAKHLPRSALIGGVGYIAAVIEAPGVIRHTGMMQALKFGEYDGRRTPRVEALLEACLKAGIDAEISDDIQQLIWKKFVFLVGLSGATASIRKPIGPIRENPHTRRFLYEIMREVVAVGRAKGVALPEDFAEDRLAFCDTLPATMSASMYHDLERGNRLELPWLSGSVAEMGTELGIPTPFNDAVSDVLALHVSGTH